MNALQSVRKQSENGLSRFTDEQISLLKRTVAKGATDDEFNLFMHLADKYALDPFAKEIWFIKRGGVPTIFTSRDGYLKIADSNHNYDGMISEYVCKNDILTKSPDGTYSHQFGSPERGPIVGAYAVVFRKDRKIPSSQYAPFDEYNSGSNPVWRSNPSSMIKKVAEVMSLKRAFKISGLVTQEEIAQEHAVVHEAEVISIQDAPKEIPQSVKPQLNREPGATSSKELYAVLVDIAKAVDWDEEKVRGWLQELGFSKEFPLFPAKVRMLSSYLSAALTSEALNQYAKKATGLDKYAFVKSDRELQEIDILVWG